MGSQPLIDHIEWLVLFAIVAAAFSLLAWKRGFFKLPSVSKENEVSSRQLLSIFGLYLGISFIVAPMLIRLLRALLPLGNEALASSPYLIMGWIQLCILSLILTAFYFYCREQNQKEMARMWKDRSIDGSRSITYDFLLGIAAWCISFPTVVIINQLCDLFLYYVFGVESYEQVAVRYLKEMLSESSTTMIIGIIAVLAAAPLIEELLFRGFLQTYFRKRVGVKAAILLSSAGFALFHLSASQGLGNISLGVSLFTFACFLGFIYERQRSLFASIGLHFAFNAVSTFRIILTPEI